MRTGGGGTTSPARACRRPRHRLSCHHSQPHPVPATRRPPMKARLMILALPLLAALCLPAAADESLATQREYLHALRSRGMAQVALEYLEKHGKETALAPVLPVELARTRLAVVLEKSLELRGPL